MKALKKDFIVIRITEEEKKEIKKMADMIGLDVSSYIRMKLLKDFYKSRENY